MIRYLTIGNSFSNNANRYMDRLCQAEPKAKVLYGRTNFGGCSLEKHWNVVRQCDLLPQVKPYAFERTGMEPVNATLREALQAEEWDFVTLQQVSRLSWVADSFEPFFGRLYGLIRELAPQAKPVIHMTWAYRIDSPQLAEWGISQQEMFENLKANYESLAGKYDCPIIPSGVAFQKARARLDYRIDDTFDFEDPKPLELPDQTGSLNIGWHWKTGNTPSGNAELAIDANHGNNLGCYLANAVWYEMLTGQHIEDNPFRPEEITEEEVKILQNAAHETVLEYGELQLGRFCGIQDAPN
jgi:hypothetical protein